MRRGKLPWYSQGGLGLPEKDYYLRTGEKDEEIRKQYVQHIGNMLKLLGASEAQASGDAQAIMKLETALATVSLDVTSQRDPHNVLSHDAGPAFAGSYADSELGTLCIREPAHRNSRKSMWPNRSSLRPESSDCGNGICRQSRHNLSLAIGALGSEHSFAQGAG